MRPVPIAASVLASLALWALVGLGVYAWRLPEPSAPDPLLDLGSYCEVRCVDDRKPLALCQEVCEGEDDLCDGDNGECRANSDTQEESP